MTLRQFLICFILTCLTGCGFALRGAQQMSFQSIYLGMNPYAELTPIIKRQLRANDDNLQVLEDKTAAQVKLEVVLDSREKDILSLDAKGQVREYQLRQRFGFRLVTRDGKTLLPYNEILVTREISFNDSQVLAKEQEEALLYRDMNADVVQQLLRRLAAAPQPGTPDAAPGDPAGAPRK